MNKAHIDINWENYPSDETPLNERNLNKMDGSIDIIDDRVITLDTTKATKTEVATLVADVTFEESTGIITITKKNGSKITIDTQMEKIAINFDYNPITQQIILTLIDGTKQYIDLSALITQYEFHDSDTVAFYIDKDGKVSVIVKEGSIEEKHLEPNYLAKIKVEVAKAESSQQAAAMSEINAKASENAAKASETAAKTSETNAKASETAAAKSATAAAISETNAKASETSASQSAATATSEAASASQSASTAIDKATIATQKATEIIGKAESAADSATKAQSYAVGGTGSREGEDFDNAKYYYQQAKDISEGLKGGLQPHGTVAFADLPALADVSTGWMFNISDEFTTTDDFKEGAGNVIPAGANIYKTSDEKWDVLAGTPVTGIKGVNEDSFRRGNVVLTAENVGAVSTGGDTAENTTAFTAAPARENLKSGESHATLFGKIVKWFSDLKEVAFTGKIPWSDVTGKPSTYAPSSHTHDERYYTESEVNSIYSGIMQNLISGDENVTTKLSKNIANGDATLDNRITAVANALKGYLPLSGGTLTGSLDIASGKYIHGTHTNGTILDILGLNKNNNCHVGNNTTPTFLHGAGYQLDISGAFICPNVSNQMSCGTKNKLWTTVFSKTGAINTSDRTKKHNIIDLTEAYEQLFLKLKPKSFIFNDGDRVHIGAISQDVEDAMQELGIEPRQFAGFCKDIRYEYTEYNEEDGTPVESSKVPCKDEDGNIIYDYALRYQEFIFLTVHMVQKLWNRVEILEKENAEMRDQIKSMQQDIAELKKIRA
ncbi:MAG: tail fiber domain-containing protein [Roseburia intestinalis]|uniref:Peptidase S74 domain-containing protein n=1 Tax=Roseburia intestinalis TaxID=166486 RepID=A0A6N3H8K3_9FIRM